VRSYIDRVTRKFTINKMDLILKTNLGPIVNVEVDDDTLILSFKKHKLIGDVTADCCSYSYLRYYNDLTSAIGKVISNIKHDYLESSDTKADYKYHDPGTFNYYSYHRYTFVFQDVSESSLELVNKSNGYYDGWIEFRLNSIP